MRRVGIYLIKFTARKKDFQESVMGKANGKWCGSWLVGDGILSNSAHSCWKNAIPYFFVHVPEKVNGKMMNFSKYWTRMAAIRGARVLAEQGTTA